MILTEIIAGLSGSAVTALTAFLAHRRAIARKDANQGKQEAAHEALVRRSLDVGHAFLDERYKDQIKRLEEKVDKSLAQHEECEKNLRRVETHLRRLVILRGTASLGAVLCANPAGIITDCNAPATALFHRERSELVGQPITVLIPPHSKAAHAERFAAWLASGRAPNPKALVVRILRGDGAEVDAEVDLSESFLGVNGWVLVAYFRQLFRQF